MARPGIRYRQVAEACDRLVAKGETPSIDKILADIGTGSKTTISNFKKQWEATSGHGQSLLNCPNTLSDDVVASVQRLHEQLKSEARVINEENDRKHAVELQNLKEKHAIEVKKRGDLLTEAAKRNENIQSKLDSLQDNFANLHAQHDVYTRKARFRGRDACQSSDIIF